jgi:hypothetical protein
VPEELLPSREPAAPPRIFVGPDLFNPPAQQGWLTLTPSLTLSGEYNDNVLLDSRDRRSDFILGLTPGLTLGVRRPGFRLLAGYNVRGHLFVKESELSGFGKEQRFFSTLFYQVSPRLTLTLSDHFILAKESNVITSAGVSAGRRDSLQNILTPALRWQATATTGFSLLASHRIIRFQDSGRDSDTRDSDTYRAALGVDRRLTARLTGRASFEVAYIDVKDEPSARTYTPTVGVSYDITPTLRGSVRGGPSIVERSGDTTLSPSLRAALTQAFKFGSLQAGYDRSVTAETIGLSDRQAVFASLVVPTLMRGLLLEFTPRYSVVDRDVADTNRNGDGDTIKTLTFNLRAVYQIARNISLIGSYTFFQERRDERGDIDQNRIFLGVQYAYPINFY